MFQKKHRSTPSHSMHRPHSRFDKNENQAAQRDVSSSGSTSSNSSYDNLHHKSPYFKKPPNFYKLLRAYPQLFAKEQGVIVVDITKRRKGQQPQTHRTDSSLPDQTALERQLTREDNHDYEEGEGEGEIVSDSNHQASSSTSHFTHVFNTQDTEENTVSLWVDHFHKRCRINWKNIPVMKALTKAMLLHDFQLNIEFPDHYLIPPLPNRINYLCWLSDLFESSQPLVGSDPNQLTIMDIGTGSSLIYPLLGHLLFHFQFIGSDINPEAITMALKNLQQNQERVTGSDGQCKIRLTHVSNSNSLQEKIQNYLLICHNNINSDYSLSQDACSEIASMQGPIRMLFSSLGQDNPSFQYRLMDCQHHWQQRSLGRVNDDDVDRKKSKSRRREGGGDDMEVDDEQSSSSSSSAPTPMRWKPLIFAVMTNPPFYDVNEQVQENDETICTGNPLEMRTIGGECAFIAGMIADSLVLRDSVLWYTAMVGKKSSLAALKHMLLAEGFPREQIFVREFAQGVTYRWGLAWTFSPEAAALNNSFEVMRPQTEHQTVNSKGLTVGVSKLPGLPVNCLYEDFARTTLREELIYVQSQCLGIIPSESINPIVTTEELPTSILYPVVIHRVRTLWSELEKALQGLNLQTHSSELSFISAQGKFQTTSVQGQLKVEPKQWIDKIDSEPFTCRVSFSVGFQFESMTRGLVDLEIVVKLVQLDDGGAVEIRSVIQVIQAHCSEGLASRIQHRVKEHFENEFVRGNRRWRRLIASKVAGSQASV